MSKGRSLELYFVDGRPEGMLTAEVFNWTGHVLRIPRLTLSDGLSRAEARQTGVYILIGENHDGPLAYIGEAEDMATRLRQHAKEKPWWDQAVLITTAGDALHKAHVKYLESRLVETALDAAAMRIENGNTPPRSSLNEAATANMESFLDTLHMVLPAIRVDLFQSGKRTADKSSSDALPEKDIQRIDRSEVFECSVQKLGITARAKREGEHFVVLERSFAVTAWRSSPDHHYKKLHQHLLSTGILATATDHCEFTQDYAFKSPSAAAAVVKGQAGKPSDWKLPDGRTYAEWEEDELNKATS
ncbi:GIY-YIG nuclease family protein [Pseudoprimorskyibacter insulae]|uniref:DUF4357 domain-containing protein n=1 Tax=Pseudoprimorskyibacter insulae TaxID=1695997 RepID=A0A2R8AXJ3_9RHOB|nr:GIY-YIG nuclease family protein [Pseudoprimorskyibacter insulae]SPF80730.1 hypothetical protein PRI8871_02541 [Pseudoprimorskyibacter insulae]